SSQRSLVRPMVSYKTDYGGKMKNAERPWSSEADHVLKLYESDPKAGLTPVQAEEKCQIYGPNTLTVKKQAGYFVIFLNQFRNPMVYILFFAAAIALALGEMLDAYAILSIVVLNGVVGFIQEFKANTALEELKKMAVPHTKVIREGKLQTISSIEVVPGDILQLEAGDFISADARIIEAYQLTTEEAPLTGESVPVTKSSHPVKPESVLAERTSMLFSGTAVNSGSALAVVTATGM